MSPEAASRRLDQIARDIPSACLKAVNRIATDARERAIWWSSGPISAATLADVGHPYAKRAPNPAYDAGRLNEQTGNLIRSWVRDPARIDGGRVVAAVFNTSREAGFMGYWKGDEWVQGADSRMVARPLPVRVMNEVAPRVEGIVQDELDRVLGR